MSPLPDFSNPMSFVLGTLGLFAIVFGRYVLIAGAFFGYFYLWQPERWRERKLGARKYSSIQYRRELTWSAITALIFSVAGAAMVLLWQQGFTRIYLELDAFGYWYLPASLAVYMLVHETYYYWLHRWMHHPSVYPLVHKIHHQSIVASPWTAFSFHPIEGLLQAIFLPIMVVLIPIHPSVLLMQLALMTFSSVINHLDIEIYPKNFHTNIFGKWLIGASHHSLHHSEFKYNFGLYFTFWDKWRKTESPSYFQLFERVTGKSLKRS
jgi:sterol desaturase/sphingolipid hydroxylase (fatty acid hydroxylase superfamily)